MNIKGNIAILCTGVREFIKSNNKSLILKKVLYKVRKTGLKGLKQSIVNTTSISHQSEAIFVDLLAQQQKKVDFIYINNKIDKMKTKPIISIIIDASKEIGDINGVLQSIYNQSYSKYEVFVLADEHSKCIQYIDDKYSPNIVLKRKDLSVGDTLNDLLEQMTGHYLMVLKADCVLTANALYEFADIISNYHYHMIYSDGCIMDFKIGKPIEYFLLPDFSPIQLQHRNYIGIQMVFEKEIIEKIGGFNKRYVNFDSVIYDIQLRLIDQPHKVKHIEKILFLRDSNITIAKNESEIVEVLKLRHKNKGMSIGITKGVYEYEYGVSQYQPNVSIIVPIMNDELFDASIINVLNQTNYPKFELIIVANDNIIEELKVKYRGFKSIIFYSFGGKDNFSAKCNKGATISRGDIVVFLRDNIVLFDKDWLIKLVNLFAFNKVGAASPKILRMDDTIQYAGMIAGAYGLSAIPYNGEINEYADTYHHWLFETRETSILSSTCLAVKKDLFEKIGGFDENNTPNKYCNIDLSFKIQEKDYSCIFCGQSLIKCNNSDWYDSWYLNGDSSGFSYILSKWNLKHSQDPYFTESMKALMLKNVPGEYKIYCNEKSNINFKKNKNGRRILLISHDLSITGAPVALHNAAKAILDNGDIPIILCHTYGNLVSDIVEDGIIVIIDPSTFMTCITDAKRKHIIDMAISFDAVVVSTLVLYFDIEILMNTNIPVLWWIHESKESYKLGGDELIPQEIADNIHAYCGGEYAKKWLIKSRPNYKANVLLYGVPDFSHIINSNIKTASVTCSNWLNKNRDSQLIFAIIGTVEERKGQDIFAKAIKSLSKEDISKCQFVFIGREIHNNIYKEIVQLKEMYPQNTILIDEVSRLELMRLYSEIDCVVCSSRDDPMPVFMSEAMMMSKICICSENTGTASLIENKVNGLLFSDNNPEQLKKQIKYVIDHYKDLDGIKNEARNTFEEYFSMDVFYKNVVNVLDNIINRSAENE